MSYFRCEKYEMKMSISELDSFILKFKSLWYSGIDAHLDVETHAGQAWVGLRVGLGHQPGPLHHKVQPHKKQASPSRQRRRARRVEARQAAADKAGANITENVVEQTEAEEANPASDAEETVEEMVDKTEESNDFCANNDHFNLDDENSLTFRFIVKDSQLSKSQGSFESEVTKEFQKAKLKECDQIFKIQRYIQLENESKFYMTTKSNPEVLGVLSKMKTDELLFRKVPNHELAALRNNVS